MLSQSTNQARRGSRKRPDRTHLARDHGRRDGAPGASLPLNSKPAEGGIPFADFERCLIVCAIEPGLQCVQAVPSLNSNSLWRRTLQGGYRLSPKSRYSSYCYEPTTGRFDDRLSLRGEFFCVSIGVRDIDFSDEINGRFRLSVKSLNSRTNRERLLQSLTIRPCTEFS
jgi:hypothetical protein